MVNMAESHRIYHADEVLKQSRDAVAGVWTDVRSFDFKWIVPYETAFSPKILSNTTTWVMLLFGFAPLLGFYVAHNMGRRPRCSLPAAVAMPRQAPTKTRCV